MSDDHEKELGLTEDSSVKETEINALIPAVMMIRKVVRDALPALLKPQVDQGLKALVPHLVERAVAGEQALIKETAQVAARQVLPSLLSPLLERLTLDVLSNEVCKFMEERAPGILEKVARERIPMSTTDLVKNEPERVPPTRTDASRHPVAQDEMRATQPTSGTAELRLLDASADMDYREYWGLREKPFENVPDPRYYFASDIHQEALHRLLYGVQKRKGAVMLTGEIGCGKTLVSRSLIQNLPTQQYDVALIAEPIFTANDLLKEILHQLGIKGTGSKVDLLHQLENCFLDHYKREIETVLIVDEAHLIQSDEIFEELRLLLNFQLNDRFLLTLVLVGQPELKARVKTIKQLAQRIAIRFNLGPLKAGDIDSYIRFRLKIANCTQELFTNDAVSLISEQSLGIPRNINKLCDLCLLIGFIDKVKTINSTIVERAALEAL